MIPHFHGDQLLKNRGGDGGILFQARDNGLHIIRK